MGWSASQLKGAGVFLFLLAFIANNHFQHRWKSEKDEIERAEVRGHYISNAATQSHMMMTILNSQEKPNPRYLMGACRNFVVAVALQICSEELHSRDEKEKKEDRPLTPIEVEMVQAWDRADNLLEAGKVDELRSLADQVAVKHKPYSDLSGRKFHARYKQVSANESYWGKIFLICFIVGSILTTLGFLKEGKSRAASEARLGPPDSTPFENPVRFS